MSEVVEQTGFALEIEGSKGLSDEAAYRQHISEVQERARAICRKGAACCMNVTVTDFTPSTAATVEVVCGDGATCVNPQLVAEVAMNCVLGENQKANVINL